MPRILVIDDDRAIRHLIAKWFAGDSAEIVAVGDAESGLKAVKEQHPDVVLLDIMLPEISGLEAFQKLRALDAKLPVIFITGDGVSNTTIEAMKLGAYDYLLKPLERDRVRKVISDALKMRRLMSVPVSVSEGLAAQDRGDFILGRSPQMQNVFKAIGRVAPQDVAVLIQGESGTGKELVARAIYQHSKRSDNAFMAINCAAIPETLLESEFFGHEKGAFTGADAQRVGKFEQCSGGTIFLDEIGDMPPALQAKILRLLQDQQFERVGGNKTVSTDVRIIAATNRDLDVLVESGEFREDLLYRLKGFLIGLPSLRERQDDIPLLLEHFLDRARRSMNKEVDSIGPDALAVLKAYDWPGNVRELESVVKQAVINAAGSVITAECLPSLSCSEDSCDEVSDAASSDLNFSEVGSLPASDLRPFVERKIASQTDRLYDETLEFMERYLLTRLMRETSGNQSQAARILGITRGRLRNRLRALGISIDQVVSIDAS
jgi:two-component system nitrogen regulation response regulator GlnG